MRSRLPLAVFPFVAHALARDVDRALGLVLRAETEPDGLLREVARALGADGSAALARAAAWLAIWALASLAVAWGRRRAQTPDSGGERRKVVVWPLLLRPALTLLALLSVAFRPSYPYGFTLPVALTQDWGIAQDLAALAAIAAASPWAPRFPAPRAIEVFALSFLAYGALVPEWAWQWDSHPGNEPKTLRQAVALGHWLTFDAEPVSGPMEKLDVRPLGASLPAAFATLGRESWRMLAAVARGEAGKDAIRATRMSRQVVQGKEGGTYSVLAPGPALLLAPSLRADRALNRARGVEGRVAVSVLVFCAFGAGLVAAVFRLGREATGRAGLAAALAFGFAFVPPGLFYFYQFYPEMLGALVLALAFRALALEPEGVLLHPWRLGFLLSFLPWLHQKFLPVWLVLVATALAVVWRSRGVTPRRVAGVVVPTLVSGFLFALYNFAITGSVRPDALFLAWGPGGVSGARVGQGLLGLVLDARYGLLPYVPLLSLAAAGFVLGGARRFAAILPAALVYYLTVASADNWAGAVCNLGRYAMPLVPLAVALVGIALARCDARRGAMALALTLAAWTAVLALALRQDPHAANDSALLLAKSTFADGLLYVPGLHIGSWADAAPGLALRVLAWLFLIVALAWWWTRAARATGPEGTGGSPLRALAGAAGLLLLVAFGLEHAAPANRTQPAWPGALAAGPGTALFLDGASTVREDEAIVGPGEVQILVRAEKAQGSLPLTMGGEGFLYVPGRPPQALRPTGAFVELPLSAYHEVRGRDRTVSFSRVLLRLEREAVLRPLSMEPAGLEVR